MGDSSKKVLVKIYFIVIARKLRNIHELQFFVFRKDSFDTISEPDSFDEPKGVPISMEPVFSTAAGIRIDVKQESIDKSKKMLNVSFGIKRK